VHLSRHHRDTVGKIFSHPTSRNIQWREVLSLLDYVGTTTEERNGKLRVTLGPETEVFKAPRGKDIDEQMIVDLPTASMIALTHLRVDRHAGFGRTPMPRPSRRSPRTITRCTTTPCGPTSTDTSRRLYTASKCWLSSHREPPCSRTSSARCSSASWWCPLPSWSRCTPGTPVPGAHHHRPRAEGRQRHRHHSGDHPRPARPTRAVRSAQVPTAASAGRQQRRRLNGNTRAAPSRPDL
jgi:hypothetical protein